MKKYITIIVLALFLSACVPTPEEEVVAHKDAEEMEEALRKTEESVTDTDQRDTVFRYEDSYQGGDKSVLININADITMPKGNVSVVHMVPHTITVDDMKILAETLFEGNEPYDARTECTKSEIEQRILERKRTLSNIESEYLRGERAKDDYLEVKADFEQQIARMKADYATAPEVIKKSPATWQFKQGSFIPAEWKYIWNEYPDDPENIGRESMRICAEIDDMEVYLEAINYAGLYQINNIYYMATNLAAPAGELKETEDEAIVIAEDFLEKAELTDWRFYSIYKVEEGPDNNSYYDLRFKRTYNGVDIVPLPQFSAIGADYQTSVRYEEMKLRVSNGRVIYIWYIEPMDIDYVVNEKAALLPFDEIKDRFKELLQSIYTIHNKYTFGGGRLDINEIQLGYARVQIPNKEREFYLAPAWFLFRNERLEDDMVKTPLLVVNAVDGTRIDTSVGY